ncbi:MAG: hypothetical protein ACYCZR_05035 [Burkholderiales bacterium]
MDWYAFTVFLVTGVGFIACLAALFLLCSWWMKAVDDRDCDHDFPNVVPFLLFVIPPSILVVTLGALAIGLIND